MVVDGGEQSARRQRACGQYCSLMPILALVCTRLAGNLDATWKASTHINHDVVLGSSHVALCFNDWALFNPSRWRGGQASSSAGELAVDALCGGGFCRRNGSIGRSGQSGQLAQEGRTTRCEGRVRVRVPSRRGPRRCRAEGSDSLDLYCLLENGSRG
jgi:hypothetical protein